MKTRIAMAIMLVFFALPLTAQDLATSFVKGLNENAKKEISQMNMSGSMLRNMVEKDENADEEMKHLAENIDRITMIAGKLPGKKETNLLEQCLTSYEEYFSSTHDGKQTRMFVKENKGRIEEFVLCVRSGNHVSLTSISGRINLQQLAKLAKSMKIEGIDRLDEATKKNQKK